MRSLHFKLFYRYAVLIFVVIIFFMASLYVLLEKQMERNATSELQADCDNISTLVDTEMKQINELSKRIVSSQRLGSLYLKDLYGEGAEVYQNRLAFSDTLFDMIKLSLSNISLNIVDESGRLVHVGSVSRFCRVGSEYAQQLDWFPQTLEAYGKPVILPVRTPEIADDQMPVVSLCRSFSPAGNQKKNAVLELQLEYSYLQQKIVHAIHNKDGRKIVLIYGPDGSVIYPYGGTLPEEMDDGVFWAMCAQDCAGQPEIRRTPGNDPFVYVCRTLDLTQWTVFVAAAENEVLMSVHRFQLLFVLLLGVTLLLTLLVTYRIAERLSAPIQNLEHRASLLTLDHLDEVDFSGAKSDFWELNSLCDSFEQMKKNLQQSLDELVAANAAVNESKILALQSQMNPHFLYNTLASISVLAEDGDDEKVMEICSDLSMLLRYISSNSPDQVSMWQEIEHTRAYMEVIKIKYEERICFSMDIDASLYELNVPKLIIQPLIENCVKYALNTKPPWEITVRGYVENQNWVIQVKDNGSGFSEAYLELFRQKTAQIASEKELPVMEIGGMGLLNLYTRLAFRYKERVIFVLENRSDGGACVTVGGPLPEQVGDVTHEKTEN